MGHVPADDTQPGIAVSQVKGSLLYGPVGKGHCSQYYSKHAGCTPVFSRHMKRFGKGLFQVAALQNKKARNSYAGGIVVRLGVSTVNLTAGTVGLLA